VPSAAKFFNVVARFAIASADLGLPLRAIERFIFSSLLIGPLGLPLADADIFCFVSADRFVPVCANDCFKLSSAVFI
jgi:hypothetical protein